MNFGMSAYLSQLESGNAECHIISRYHSDWPNNPCCRFAVDDDEAVLLPPHAEPGLPYVFRWQKKMPAVHLLCATTMLALKASKADLVAGSPRRTCHHISRMLWAFLPFWYKCNIDSFIQASYSSLRHHIRAVPTIRASVLAFKGVLFYNRPNSLPLVITPGLCIHLYMCGRFWGKMGA
jgi:hypothetical protein